MQGSKRKKQVAIQKRIEEVMKEEFERMLTESVDDPLLKLIRNGKLDSLSLEQIKEYLKGVQK